MDDVAMQHVLCARQLASNKDCTSAFNMYIRALESDPLLNIEIENEFITIFLKMIEQQIVHGSVPREYIFSHCNMALYFYPGDVDLLNDIGSLLYHYSYTAESLLFFEKALNIDKSHVALEKNVNNAKSFLFPSRNFRILNDKIRNDAYRAAIRSCINPATDSVIDIGAGTGTLALYADKCDPIAVTANETTTSMGKLAEWVMQVNQAPKVFIVNQAEIGALGSRSLLLTGRIDEGLFGENILQSLCHAWEHWWWHTENKIIPGRAEFFVVGINCDELNGKYKLGQYIKNILNIPHHTVHTTTHFAETYHSGDVGRYENVKYICEPQSLFTIDFNNRDEVTEMLSRQKPYNAILKPTVDDEMNMVIGWFNLHLTDDIMLTNDPRSENRSTSWEQALFFDVLSRKVQQNESIVVRFVPYGGRLTTLPEPGKAIARVSSEILAYLNDREYMNMIIKSVGAVFIHLEQVAKIEDVDVVDLSPFPLFGILMMKRGANSLICHAKTGDCKTFLHTVLEANGIPVNKVTILDSDHWSRKVFKRKRFHVIVGDFFDFNGDIVSSKESVLHRLKNYHLATNGIFLPASVTLMGQLIYSHDLAISNRVADNNVGCEMEKHVNRYQTSQLTCLDIARLQFDPLSEPFEVSTFEDMHSKTVQVPIPKDGACNAILCWYKVELVEGWHVTYTNRSNSYVSSTAFMTNPVKKLSKDDILNVILRVGGRGDRSFMLAFDNEP